MKLYAECPICQKPLRLDSEVSLAEGYWRTYKCGHCFYEPSAAVVSPSTDGFNFASCTGKYNAFEFQEQGVEFAMGPGNYSCLIGDPMGLGKTIQAALIAREARNADGTAKFKCCLGIVKSANIYQWFGELKEWYSQDLWSVFMIVGSKGFIPPGFRFYLISMDTLSRYMKTPAGTSALKALGVDLCIVDECHSFKNPDSARSQALVAYLQDISFTEIERPLRLNCVMCGEQWQETTRIKINLRGNLSNVNHRHQTECPKCHTRTAQTTEKLVLDERERSKGLILLSGTPIKNRADEYFIPLNLLRPEVFTSLKGFQRNWCVQNENGKYTRIAPWRQDEFKRITSSFIIRREKNEVLSLPAFRRTFNKVNIEDDKFKQAYNAALQQLQDKVDELAAQGKEMSYFELESNLMRLRRIVGLGKLPMAVEYIEEFIETVENEKIIIGIHHESVRDNLYFALRQKAIPCLKFSGEDSAEKKNSIVQQFNSDPSIRVMIVNMIAGGIGLNLQVANNILVVERQWNAADEEQFEGRCHRQGQTLPVLAAYMIAEGLPTEDYFTDLVESKRSDCSSVLDSGWNFQTDTAAVRELVHRTLAHKL